MDTNPETMPIYELCKPISATVMPKRASWSTAQQTACDGPTLQAQRQSTTNTLRKKLRAAQKRKAEQ